MWGNGGHKWQVASFWDPGRRYQGEPENVLEKFTASSPQNFPRSSTFPLCSVSLGYGKKSLVWQLPQV